MQMQIQPVHQQMSFSLNNCRKVLVQRDYSSGLGVKFSTKLPAELQGKLDAKIFEKTVRELNEMYDTAEQLSAESVYENVVGCLTCYLSHMCMNFQFEKHLKQIAKFIKEQNETIYLPRGFFIADPAKRGLRVIEISILSESNMGTSNA